MKTVLKVLLATTTVITIMFAGVYGAIIFTSNTSTEWILWGYLLTVLTIVQPTVSYWYSKLEWLLDLKD
jgi:uncharacterized membrane protein YcaP (DUF421 family)